MTNITFSQELKDHWIAVMQEHQDQDRIIQGDWLRTKNEKGIFSGCFFGCAMQTENDPLQKAIQKMNLPSWLIYLAEAIFEGLPKDLALTFPVDLLKSIPVDADIESVKHDLAIIRLQPLADKFEKSHPEISRAITDVIDCHKNWKDDPDWPAASSAASSAADYAAESADYAARSAADSAARSAWYSADSAARSAARSAAWTTERDNLIKLLQEI